MLFRIQPIIFRVTPTSQGVIYSKLRIIVSKPSREAAAHAHFGRAETDLGREPHERPLTAQGRNGRHRVGSGPAAIRRRSDHSGRSGLPRSACLPKGRALRGGQCLHSLASRHEDEADPPFLTRHHGAIYKGIPVPSLLDVPVDATRAAVAEHQRQPLSTVLCRIETEICNQLGRALRQSLTEGRRSVHTAT